MAVIVEAQYSIALAMINPRFFTGFADFFRTRPFSTRSNSLVYASVALAVVLAFFFWPDSNAQRSFVTSEVARGDLLVTINATGTLEPEEIVDIGAQVAGQIASFGVDRNGKIIDYGSEVVEGAVLAQIDDSIYRSDELEAEARVKQAKASLNEAHAKLFQAERDWKRAEKLKPTKILAQTTYDSYEAAFRTAKAGIDVAEAGVTQAEASVIRAKRNLSYTTIRAPVSGVVIDRRVDIGQTVVASLNAPSLFLLAKDLRKMEIWVSVNEADIAQIRPGQKVTFTVDARPNEIFTGSVSKVRLNASMSQNVVTYIVEVNTDNSDGKLLPYLTANVRFEVDNFKDVLLVENTALRFSPRDSEAPRIANSAGTQTGVWIQNGAKAQRVPVTVLGTDGTLSAVSSESLTAGARVITGQQATTTSATQAGTNPFAPPMRGGRR